MRRAAQHSAKPSEELDEIVQLEQCKSATVMSNKKSKKNKNAEKGNKLAQLKESENIIETGRTRSVSSVPPIAPVEADLPLEKFYKIFSKIVAQMETVKEFTTSKKNETENLLDLRRQLQRADEFSIRFSRNNVYETKRIINDIKKLFLPSPFEKSSPDFYRTLFKKIILAFQAASQALQTYINYVQNPCNLEVPDKINELVVVIADLILCCEHIKLPAEKFQAKNDAAKMCNELMVLFKSRTPVCEYVELKEADLSKKRGKTVTEDMEKNDKFSMYKPKFGSKFKPEMPKKKNLFSSLARKCKKNDKTAMLTHEIYTQKLNSWEGNGFNGNKIVNFKQNDENPLERKPSFRRGKYKTPREVRSQDDDVETMVQTIGDDETISRIGSTPRKEDEDKPYFKELLLEAIEELKTGDKTEQKLTIDKLLNSIQSYSKPNPERVKVYHFVSGDCFDENKTEPEVKVTEEQTIVKDVEEIPQKVTQKERRFGLFKPLRPNNGGADGEFVSRGKVRLKLSEEAMNNANKYRKAFAEFRKNNIMYKRTLTNTPWALVGKVSDRIILDLIKEISLDFQNDTMLRELYLSELLEVAS